MKSFITVNNLQIFEINKVVLVYLCNASPYFPSAPNPTPYSYVNFLFSKRSKKDWKYTENFLNGYYENLLRDAVNYINQSSVSVFFIDSLWMCFYLPARLCNFLS